MKKCKDCGKEVSNSAKVCPNCGKTLKKPIIKFVILGIIIICIIGCVATMQKEEKKESERKKEFSQNEIATYNEVNYSITKIERTSGDEYSKAPEGKEYIVISLKIENKSEDKISYNSLDWKLEDSTGDEYGYAIWGNTNDASLSFGDLNVGGTKTGTIVFEVPKNDKKLTLKYYENILVDKKTFEFKITD